MDKFQQYIDVQWWSGVEKRDLENWIRNFGVNSTLAELVLNNVIFYNEKQLKSYTKFLVDKLQGQVYLKTIQNNHFSMLEDYLLMREWDRYLSETRFLPAAKITDPTSSAHKILGYWRSILERGNRTISTIVDIENMYNEGVRRFILVDDFAGSGKQMKGVLKEKIKFHGQYIEVGHLPDVVKDIELVVAVYVMHEKAKETLRKDYSKISLMYVDLIGNEYSFLNENSLIYEKYDTQKIKDFINDIQELSQSIVDENNELVGLSSYILNIPIVFEHGCPNNTLILLFAHSDNWQQLFKRGEDL